MPSTVRAAISIVSGVSRNFAATPIAETPIAFGVSTALFPTKYPKPSILFAEPATYD